jgi:predicted phage-related endonuclease
MTPEELKLIGMSDVPALLGLDKNRSPWDVYARIVGGKETPDTPILKRGRRFEPVIRELAKEECGLHLLGPLSFRDPARPYLRASLDDRHFVSAHLEPEVVEFKSVSPWAADDLGESGTDHVKETWLVQVQGYLWTTQAARAHVVALIGLDEVRHFIVQPQLDLQEIVAEAIDRFFVDHIEPKRPPAVDASEGCAEWFAQQWPKHRENSLLTANADDARVALEYRAARAQREAAEEREGALRNALIARIGDAEGIAGDGWKITFRYTQGKTGISKEALEKDGLLEKYTKRGNGFRRFVPKFKGMEEMKDE